MSEDEKKPEGEQKPPEGGSEKVSDPKTWADAEVKKIIEERDKAKQKLRKIEDEDKKRADEKAIEEGKLKEVLAEKEKRLVELEQVAVKAKETEDKQRELALAKINDEKLKQIASELSTVKLLEFVELQQSRGSAYDPKARIKEADDPRRSKPGEGWLEYDKRMNELDFKQQVAKRKGK